MTSFEVKKDGEFTYLDEGAGDLSPIVLLHGLFGTASNFDSLIKEFRKERRVIMPILPIFELPLNKVSLKGLLDYFSAFIKWHCADLEFHLLGNSLGGHLAILYALENQNYIRSLILTGSSGLYESAFGTSFPKREDYEFIKQRVKVTFYDPDIATKEMVDEVFEIVNSRMKGIRLVKTAKSAIRHNVKDRLGELKLPCLLVWGKDDKITPAFVGEQFHELISNSTLHIFDKCGHAPMLERPVKFNNALIEFLSKVEADYGVGLSSKKDFKDR